MNVNELVAIDVHTHAEVSWFPPRGARSHPEAERDSGIAARARVIVSD
jgi:hypothetical protein